MAALPSRPTLHIGRTASCRDTVTLPGPSRRRGAATGGPTACPPWVLSCAIASPSALASRRATPPWLARGSTQPWYRIARRPERSRGRPKSMSRTGRTGRETATERPTSAARPRRRRHCPMYVAPLLQHAKGAGQSGPDRTYVAGARCSTDAEIWGRLRIFTQSAHACTESRTSLAACQACPVYCRQMAPGGGVGRGEGSR